MTATQVLTELDHAVGQCIPPGTAHAVSVSLPSWKANVGYEEGEEWIMSKMKNGYPRLENCGKKLTVLLCPLLIGSVFINCRFFIHKSIEAFAAAIVHKYGKPGEQAILFPSHAIASRCLDFFTVHAPSISSKSLRIVDLVTNPEMDKTGTLTKVPLRIAAVIFPREHSGIAKTFWQHTGDGVSSRRAEFCHKAFNNGSLVKQNSASYDVTSIQRPCKGPRRYQKTTSSEQNRTPSLPRPNEESLPPDAAVLDGPEYTQFVEERFGRNLDMSFVANAKLAIRRRITGSLTADVELEEALEMTEDTGHTRKVKGFSENDVYLHPTGMSAIFNTHRTLMAVRGPMKSICFGFPYIDTLKILQKWGPGCLFYGHGSSEDLNDLERRVKQGEKYLALFCEFPSNPLLKSPDLQRIRSLATAYNFAVVVDETIGNFMNVHVLPYADVVVSSLTKVFSGDSNVMGGSSVLNPRGQYYSMLKTSLSTEYEDNYWAEDAIFMERNSRDFVSRIERININAEAICQVLRVSPQIKEVYYPKYSPTRHYYDQCRNPNGGYGGLLSITFHSTAEAVRFFDVVETAKGPSLGTNFTLSSPYTLLAHYAELDWAASFGVEADLVRVSVGLEDAADLSGRFERALQAVASILNS
ncbi:MAG: hypothetical protein M1830_000803 [Pleopsidium flavum]|nr:MAG: hypothetical protein M1830_000803 [Pleopsidium flavum]